MPGGAGTLTGLGTTVATYVAVPDITAPALTPKAPGPLTNTWPDAVRLATTRPLGSVMATAAFTPAGSPPTATSIRLCSMVEAPVPLPPPPPHPASAEASARIAPIRSPESRRIAHPLPSHPDMSIASRFDGRELIEFPRRRYHCFPSPAGISSVGQITITQRSKLCL